MKYHEEIVLKDGRTCCLRNGTEQDGQALLDIFNRTHAQTEFLLTYVDECAYTVEDEARYLKERTEDPRAIEIVAELDGAIVGSAGIEAVGTQEKVRHRAEFGISIDRACWGLGIGRALTRACVTCARRAGYAQLELDVAVQNASAIALYESEGFVEFGRNPRAFRTRSGEWQECALMRLEL
ncbi:MAG: GNAT family N-acetyltransferase [Atopobiaceae bacterium]|nr:GNAT family N-acetyltransferase [Atopobiaceae bacterium]